MRKPCSVVHILIVRFPPLLTLRTELITAKYETPVTISGKKIVFLSATLIT